jgi:hypothetical protein
MYPAVNGMVPGQTQENSSNAAPSQPSTAHWEDEYEQEDPVTPEGRVFKVNRSSRSDEDFTELTDNPWQFE